MPMAQAATAVTLVITQLNRTRAASLAALVREGKVFVTVGGQQFQNPEWSALLRHNTPAETAATAAAFLDRLKEDGDLRRLAADQRIELEDLEDQLREFCETENDGADGGDDE